jgi:hypothetical protein
MDEAVYSHVAAARLGIEVLFARIFVAGWLTYLDCLIACWKFPLIGFCFPVP